MDCLCEWVTVTRAMTESMLVLGAREAKWWMSLLQGQPERKQNGWVPLSQHPAKATSLHHSSLELYSAAKTNKNKKKNVIITTRIYSDLQPPSFSKAKHRLKCSFQNWEEEKRKWAGGHAVQCTRKFLRHHGRTKHSFQILIMDLMKSQSSWDIFQWQDAGGIYLNLTEQRVLWTSFSLKAFNAPDEF